MAAIRAQRARDRRLRHRGRPPARDLSAQLGDLVLAGEADNLRPAQQAAVLHNTASAVDAQLSQLVVAGQPITLTSQRGRLPVTIVSNAPYPVTASLTLTSDKLLFTQNGLTQLTVPVLLHPQHPTSSTWTCRPGRRATFRVGDRAQRSGRSGLPLSVGEITVRSTATSVVGIILSLGAVLVLVVWWVRTSRQAARHCAVHTRWRKRAPPAEVQVTDIEVDGLPAAPGGGRRRLAGATAGMAVGTTLSRITGVVRVIALTTALGGAGFADAYNLANTTPNIITDIVIGGVLSATFVPVFVDHLTTRRTKEAWEAISAVVTVTITVLVAATVAFFFLTPEIIHLYTVTNHNSDVTNQRQVAVFFLRWFVPQLTCYGLIALFTALLNAQGKFAAPMFVPIANNLVVIGVLVWFHALVPHPTLASVDAHHTRPGAPGLRHHPRGRGPGRPADPVAAPQPTCTSDSCGNPAHEAMRTITRLAGWTFGWVVANQVALVVILALADGAKVPGAVSAYTYAYTFFQLPYGVVAVSVMSAVTPSLAARWARRRHRWRSATGWPSGCGGSWPSSSPRPSA